MMSKTTVLPWAAKLIPTLTAVATFAAVMLLAGHARAADYGWDGDLGDDLWSSAIFPPVTTNWFNSATGVEDIPLATDSITLANTSLAGPVTIDLNGPQAINFISAAGVAGTYTFINNGAGALEFVSTIGPPNVANVILTINSSALVFDTDILLNTTTGGDFTSLLNVRPGGGQILVNGNVSTSAATGTATLQLTSRNTGLAESVKVTGIISDGSSATMALEAGFAGDADQHRGEVVVTGANTYTGRTDVNGATLTFNSIADVDGGASALGAPTTVVNGTIDLGINAAGGSAPGTLKYTGAGHSSDRVINLAGTTQGGIIDASGTGALVLSGGITTSANGSKTLVLTGNNTDEITISGVINDVSGGSVFVTKAGAGTWVLTGANQAAGTTNVNDGELILRGAGSAISASGSSSPFRINNDATFTLEGGTVNATEMDRAAAATFNFKSGTVNLSTGTSTFQAASGPLTIGTDGDGILNLNGTVAQINGGVVIQGPGDELNLTASSLTTTSLDNSNGGTFNFTGGSVVINTGQITTGAGTFGNTTTVSGTGGITKIGAGTLILNGDNVHSGPTNINEGTIQIGAPSGVDSFSNATTVTIASGATLDMNGSDEGFGGLAGAGSVLLGGATLNVGFGNQTTTFSGVISGNGNFGKFGTGTLTLTGNNTYNGLTPTVGTAGTLKLAAGNTLPDLTRVTLSISGATLDLDNQNEEIGGLSGVAGTVVSLGTATLTTGGNDETFNNFDGNITGTGGLTKVGTGIQRLRATNSFTGDVNVNNGTLEIGVSNTLGTNAVIVASGATLRVAGNGESFGSLAGAGTVNATVNVVNTVNPGFNDTDTTFSGTIIGIGEFGKSGTGTMTMTGSSSYTGATRVNNGTLVFDGASAGLAGTSGVLLNGGDLTLKNNATINTSGNIALQTTTSSLLIESGGVATVFQANIGQSTGSDGSATVTGVGSQIQSSSRTRVGDFGKGTLDVLNGGRVITGERLAIADSGAGSANSAVLIDGFINNGVNGIFGDDDDEVSLVNAAFAVFVGDAATGFLTVQNGGRLVSGTGSNNHTTNFSIIGVPAIADGSIATVTGNQSRWVHNGFMEVARQAGDATNPVELNVLDGGFAEFSFLQSSTRDGSRSKITVDGANSTLHLRDARGDAGVVSPGFGDIRMVTPNSNGFSEIFVTNGGRIDIDTRLAIGQGTADFGGQAHVTVDGAGSVIDAGKEMIVAFAGSTGTLTITDGGTVNSGTDAAVDPNALTRDGFISRTSGNGTAIVGSATSDISTWNIGANLWVAGNQTGTSTSTGTLNVNTGGVVAVTNTLTVRDNGTVNLDGGTLELDNLVLTDSNANAGGTPTFNFNTGTLRFTTAPGTTLNATQLDQVLGGPTPTLTTGRNLIVDNNVTLSAPLRLNGGSLSVGAIDAGSAANLDVDAGTFNLTASDLTVGTAGQFGATVEFNSATAVNVTNGNLVVESGGVLNTNGGFSAQSGTNDGQISTVGGSLAFSNGATNNAAGQINAINATLDFGLTGLTNTGQLNLINTTVNGTLANNGSAAVSGTNTFTGAVSGAANYTGAGTVIFENTYAPGNSPAAVSVGGNLGFGSNGSLVIDVEGTTPGINGHDQVAVTGNVAFDGTLELIVDTNTFTPVYGNVFKILTYGSRTGTFGQVTLNGSILTLQTDLALAPVYDFPGSSDSLFAATPFAAAPDSLTLFTTLPGDANLDLQVEDADLSLLLTNFGNTGAAWTAGDFTGDGIVDDADLSLLLTNFGGDVRSLFSNTGFIGNASTIPEPTSLAVFSLGGLLLIRRRAVIRACR